MHRTPLGIRLSVVSSTTASSVQGRLHRGEYGEIIYLAEDPETGEIRRFTVSLESRETIELAPAEVDMLD